MILGFLTLPAEVAGRANQRRRKAAPRHGTSGWGKEDNRTCLRSWVAAGSFSCFRESLVVACLTSARVRWHFRTAGRAQACLWFLRSWHMIRESRLLFWESPQGHVLARRWLGFAHPEGPLRACDGSQG